MPEKVKYNLGKMGPICQAAYNDATPANLPEIKRLIENGTPVDERGGDLNFTPLHLACMSERGNAETVEYLLAQGADHLAKDNTNNTPLNIAAGKGDRMIVKQLLAVGCPVDHQNRGGWTPLMLAVKHQHGEAAKMLLDAGANCDLRNMGVCARRGNTALEMMQLHRTMTGNHMAYLDNINILELLRQKTTEPSCVDEYMAKKKAEQEEREAERAKMGLPPVGTPVKA